MAYIVLIVSDGDGREVINWEGSATLENGIKDLLNELAEGKLYLLTDFNNPSYSVPTNEPAYNDRPYKQFATVYDDENFVLQNVIIGDQNESIPFEFEQETGYAPGISTRYLSGFDDYIFLKVPQSKEELIQLLNPTLNGNDDIPATMKGITQQLMRNVEEVVHRRADNEDIIDSYERNGFNKKTKFTIKPAKGRSIQWQPPLYPHSKQALNELIKICETYESHLRDGINTSTLTDKTKAKARLAALSSLIQSLPSSDIRAQWSDKEASEAFIKFKTKFNNFSKNHLQDQPNAADKEFWRKMKAAFSLGVYALIRGYRVGSLSHFYKSRKEILKEKAQQIETDTKAKTKEPKKSF